MANQQQVYVSSVSEVREDTANKVPFFTAHFVVRAGIFSETVHRNFWKRNNQWQVAPEDLKKLKENDKPVEGLELFQVQTEPHHADNGYVYTSLKGVRIAALSESIASAVTKYGRVPLGGAPREEVANDADFEVTDPQS